MFHRHAVMLLVLYVFTSAVADITVLSGAISLLFLFSMWLDLRSVSPTINTYIQLVSSSFIAVSVYWRGGSGLRTLSRNQQTDSEGFNKQTNGTA